MLRKYYLLTKPGIVRGNLMAAVAGFLLASRGSIDFGILLGVIIGLGLIIASACVFNNVIDRDIDKKMKRTKLRATVTGEISVSNALFFAGLLLLIGSVLMFIFTNALSLLIALFGHFAYVVMYGYAKRRTVYGTEIGSISGAVPPVVGYVAVTGNVDTAAIILFVLLVLWQMPHFYAIGMFREKDYRAAKIPVLPIIKGINQTKVRILLYCIAFSLVMPLLFVGNYVGYTYLFVMVGVCIYWLQVGIVGFNSNNDKKWAGKMFGISLVVLSAFCIMISISAWLP